ncbi:MAG: efflux RND transporter periplasmic adaptor subunit [Clostridia bacterium]|nr:efflux RND transporter periplasmic adaptor subunit [Clostridia bacterium]
MKDRTRVFIMVLLGVLTVTLLVNFIYAKNKESKTEGDEGGKPVALAEAAVMDLGNTAKINAQIDPAVEIHVSPKVSAKVVEIYVSEGQRVKPGQALIALENKEIMAQLKQAEAALEKAKTALVGTQGQIAQAETGLETSRSSFENAKKEYERMDMLHQQGVISEQQYESVKLQYELAESNFQLAQQQWEITKETSQRLAESDIKQAEAAYELAKMRLDDTVIRSPINGVVAGRSIDPGEMASPGMAVITVVDMDTVIARANITERDVNRLKVGQKVEVEIETISDEALNGEISNISPSADKQKSSTFNVEVKIPNPDHVIKPGMMAVILARVEEIPRAVVVPIDAVIEHKGEETVFVLDNDKASARSVKTGLKDDNYVEIVSGLKVGEKVIVEGQHLLNDGDEVIVTIGGTVE